MKVIPTYPNCVRTYNLVLKGYEYAVHRRVTEN